MITIFTPIYNRADIVGRLYHSLLEQTNYDFEWLIIDDGSTDNISEVIHGWQKEKKAPFGIRFYRKVNGGKHRAINEGVQLAKGEAFFIVDSDDYIARDAVQSVCEWWTDISGDDKFAGISGLKGTNFEQIIGDKPDFDSFVDATNIERKAYGLLGDKAEIYKTSILRKYPFPEIEGENFLTEAVVWDKIGYDGLKIRWFNKIIMICEYREDGLTSRGKSIFIDNPKGWGKYIRQKCCYYNLSITQRIYEYFEYYIELKTKLSDSEIRNNLQIDEKIFNQLKQLHKDIIDKTIDKIGNKIAVYGLGARGKKILKIYEKSKVEICYVMDQKKVEVPYLQIDLEGQFPFADAIIVTPKYGQDEIMNFLQLKTNNKVIGFGSWEASVLGRIDE